MTSLQKEVRAALLGRIGPGEDGTLCVMGADDFRLPIGVNLGADAVRFLGVGKRVRTVKTDLGEEDMLKAGVFAMQNVGRFLMLLENPDVGACFIRYILTMPAVLTLEFRDGVPVITAWAGRGPTGWISRRRALAKWEKFLPEGTSISQEKPPKEEKEEKKAKKKDKKEKKARRKRGIRNRWAYDEPADMQDEEEPEDEIPVEEFAEDDIPDAPDTGAGRKEEDRI